MRSTFKLSFFLKRHITKKNGLMPVMARITINGSIAQFSCKADADPKLWDMRTGRLSGRSDHARDINRILDQISAGVEKHYRELVRTDEYVNAEKVRNAYLGTDNKCMTLLQVYERHNDDFEKMYRAGSRTRSTRGKYLNVYMLLKEFIRQRYNRSDIALKELQPAFITDFEFYLRTVRGCQNNTVKVYILPLRRMIAIAMNNGWLQRDPFFGYHLEVEETDREFLTKDEIKTLMEHKFKSKKRELLRDMFIFCCFTGFAYSDLKSMTIDNLQSSFDESHQWIVKRRDKTNITSTVPVLGIPRQILEKYRGLATGNLLLPAPDYKAARTMIKAVAKECGIEKRVHWHMSRHTYATEICLSNGVPIESLSRMMGHKNIKTTQIYAKITHEKLSRDAEALACQLNGVEQFRNVAL